MKQSLFNTGCGDKRHLVEKLRQKAPRPTFRAWNARAMIGEKLWLKINFFSFFPTAKSHGTRCAGEVAAARDNGVCGVGVAYDSMIAGIRMLDQPYMTDLIEANSMGHEPDLIDIYSASWGPTDDGKTVDGPRNATMRAIVRGVNEVRSV